MELIKRVTKSQIIVWIIFIAFDFFTEITQMTILTFNLVIVIPIVISLVYLENESELCKKNNLSKNRLYFIVSIIWSMETVILGLINYILFCLIGLGQHITPGIIDLNGIEYIFFSFALIILPIAITIMVKLYKFLILKLRNIKNNGR